MPDQKDLHVVIVNFRSAHLAIRCVGSILKRQIVGPQAITIVENCSGDQSYDRMQKAMPDIRIKQSAVNGGFGAGVNFGCAGLTSKYLLILNPDTYFESDSVAAVVTHMDANPKLGLVGLDLVNPDGSRQFSARRFYCVADILARRMRGLSSIMHRRIEEHLMMEAFQRELPFDAEWVMGTGFIVRRDVLEQTGGMDESYFLYMEDVDLCARVWCAGYSIQCIPKAELVHDHQRSSAASPLSFAGKTHIRSLIKFARKFTLPIFLAPGLDGIRESYRRTRAPSRRSWLAR